MTYIQMSVEEFHQRADAVLQRAEQYMSEYHREKLKTFMYKVKAVGRGNVAEWQAGHLRVRDYIQRRVPRRGVLLRGGTMPRTIVKGFASHAITIVRKATTPTSSGTFQRHFIQGTSDDYRPPYADYLRVTDNKYFPKIWAAHTDEAKFPAGSLVQVRAESALPLRNPLSANDITTAWGKGWGFKKLAGQAALVLDTNPFQPSECRPRGKAL